MNYIQESTILVIDDEISNLVIVDALLGDQCQQLIVQTNPLLGLVLLEKTHIDLILLDIMMPEIDGYEMCQRLKAKPSTQYIPVIFLSSLIRASDKVKGFEAGGVDYISKPFQVEEMLARIESCLKLHHQLQQTQQNTLNLKKLEAYALTARELDILSLYITGRSRKKIAKAIYLSEHTIKWHLANIFKKLTVKNRAELLEKMSDT